MTLYEMIKSMTIEELAQFMSELQASHEQNMFEQLSKQGVEVTLIREMPAQQVNNYMEILEEEVDDYGTW